jgi:hypothetical protein
MGTFVTFEPDNTRGRVVKIASEAELEGFTGAEWDMVGFIQDDQGVQRFLLSRPRRRDASNEKNLREALARAYHRGAGMQAAAVKSKATFDPVAEAQEYAKRVDLNLFA